MFITLSTKYRLIHVYKALVTSKINFARFYYLLRRGEIKAEGKEINWNIKNGPLRKCFKIVLGAK